MQAVNTAHVEPLARRMYTACLDLPRTTQPRIRTDWLGAD